MLWLPADFFWLMLNVASRLILSRGDEFRAREPRGVRARARRRPPPGSGDVPEGDHAVESYDPSAGKTVETRFRLACVFLRGCTPPGRSDRDDIPRSRHGQGRTESLVAGSPTEFALAATGNLYPDGRQQFYHHRREHAAWKTAKDNGSIGESLADYRARRAAAWAASAGEAEKRRESNRRVVSD